MGHQLEQLFEDGEGGALPSKGLKEAVAANKAFCVHVARSKKAAGSGSAAKSGALTLNFR